MGRAIPSPKLMMITTVATILTLLASTCMAGNILLSGQEGLNAGQSLDVEHYSFKMQQDCNLVLYRHSTPIWQSGTAAPGLSGCRASLQTDGNFGVYDARGRTLWDSKSRRGNGNYILVLEGDGNVVIYGSDIWSTGTARKRVRGAVVVATNGRIDGGSVIEPVAVNQNATNILLSGESLYVGQSLDVEHYSLKMQADCNLVLYENSKLIWQTGTAAPGLYGCRAVIQGDGNFVVYNARGRALWASNSYRGNGNYILVLEEDGNVVIYGSDIWSTGTARNRVRGDAGEVAAAA